MKCVVAGSHSLRSLENGGIFEIKKVGIETGTNMGLVNVKDIFYRRQTVRKEALVKFENYTHYICHLLKEPIKQYYISATAVIWTDGFMKSSYLDFTLFCH